MSWSILVDYVQHQFNIPELICVTLYLSGSQSRRKYHGALSLHKEHIALLGLSTSERAAQEFAFEIQVTVVLPFTVRWPLALCSLSPPTQSYLVSSVDLAKTSQRDGGLI